MSLFNAVVAVLLIKVAKNTQKTEVSTKISLCPGKREVTKYRYFFIDKIKQGDSSACEKHKNLPATKISALDLNLYQLEKTPEVSGVIKKFLINESQNQMSPSKEMASPKFKEETINLKNPLFLGEIIRSPKNINSNLSNILNLFAPPIKATSFFNGKLLVYLKDNFPNDNLTYISIYTKKLRIKISFENSFGPVIEIEGCKKAPISRRKIKGSLRLSFCFSNDGDRENDNFEEINSSLCGRKGFENEKVIGEKKTDEFEIIIKSAIQISKPEYNDFSFLKWFWLEKDDKVGFFWAQSEYLKILEVEVKSYHINLYENTQNKEISTQEILFSSILSKIPADNKNAIQIIDDWFYPRIKKIRNLDQSKAEKRRKIQ